MPRNCGDMWNCQTLFEQSRNAFMAQIVKVQILEWLIPLDQVDL